MPSRDIVRLSAIVIGLTAGPAHAGRNREAPLDICNVLSHLSEYRGKMVQLRGALRGGYHGQFIVDAAGFQVCSQLERTGHHWPAAIAITQWQEGDDVEDGPAPFEPNVEEIVSRLADAKRRVRENSTLEIVASFEGNCGPVRTSQFREQQKVGSGGQVMARAASTRRCWCLRRYGM